MPIWHVYWLGVLGQWSTSGTSHNRVHTFLGPDPPREAHIWVCSWLHRIWMKGVGRVFGEILQVHLGKGGIFWWTHLVCPWRRPHARKVTSPIMPGIQLEGSLTTLTFFSMVYFVHMHHSTSCTILFKKNRNNKNQNIKVIFQFTMKGKKGKLSGSPELPSQNVLDVFFLYKTPDLTHQPSSECVKCLPNEHANKLMI